MKDVVRVFSENSGKMTYEEEFKTAERAYEEYKEIIRVLKKTLPSGKTDIVVRYSDGCVMAMETIVGTK